jgi:hypothetical protein
MEENFRIFVKACILAVFIFIIYCFIGCEATRKVKRNESNSQLTESSEKITKRLGDTVRYEVPNVVFKDTIITRKNYVTGTTQTLYYDKEGKLTAAECVSGFIEVIEKNNKELIEAIKEKDLESEKSVSPMIILYFFIGFALVVAVAIFVLFYQFRKQSKVIEQVLSRL